MADENTFADRINQKLTDILTSVDNHFWPTLDSTSRFLDKTREEIKQLGDHISDDELREIQRTISTLQENVDRIFLQNVKLRQGISALEEEVGSEAAVVEGLTERLFWEIRGPASEAAMASAPTTRQMLTPEDATGLGEYLQVVKPAVLRAVWDTLSEDRKQELAYAIVYGDEEPEKKT